MSEAQQQDMSDTLEQKGDLATREEIVSRLLCPNKWIRLFWVLVYVGVGGFVAFASLFLVFVQWLFLLCASHKNQELERLLGMVHGFLSDALAYIFYLCDEKPFPFSAVNAFVPKRDDVANSNPPAAAQTTGAEEQVTKEQKKTNS